MVGVFEIPAIAGVAGVFGIALLAGVAISIGVGGWCHGWLRRAHVRRQR